MSDNKIKLRSEEVQDILTKMPHWMIRWGNFIILVIVLGVFLISYLISYPDVINAEIVVTTTSPPEKLVAHTSGRIEKIFVKNQQHVQKGMLLAVIENTANYNDVLSLKLAIDNLRTDKENFFFPFEKFKSLQLGDIAEALDDFEKKYLEYHLNKELRPYQVEGSAKQYEKSQITERLKLIMQQKRIAEKELILKKKELDRYEVLNKKGVVSAQEFELKNLEYLQYEKNIANIDSSISELRSDLNELEKSTKSISIQETKDKVNFYSEVLHSYNQLRKTIADWEMKYAIISTNSGRLSYLGIWKENQVVNEGDNFFTVVPDKGGSYLGRMKASVNNSGKILKGQKVNIRLANYPDREFGIIQGVINEISLVPDKDGFIVINVSLPKELLTSYHKRIEFKQEMTGSAQILTRDLNLLQRVLYQVRDAYAR